MKILVTGSLGFIGLKLFERLINLGHEVVGIDVKTGVDIRNREELEKIFNINKFDAVFHTAAVARTQDTIENPLYSHDINLTGTLNLLECSKRHGVKRFINSSSSIVYAPVSPYSIQKRSAEEYCDLYNFLYKLSTISLRYSNVYGPDQSEEGSYPNVLASFKRDKREKGFITIYGDGEQTRSFIHVDDVVEANILAMNSKVNGWIDIATDKYTSLNQLIEYFNCEVKYEKERIGDFKHIPMDPFKASMALGFRAKIKLDKESLAPYL